MDEVKLQARYAAVLGRVIAEARKDRKLRQRELAEAVGVGVPTWSKIENGESSLSVEQLRVASTELGTSPSRVLALVEEAVERLPEKGVIVVMESPHAGETALKGAAVGGAVLGGVAGAAIAGGAVGGAVAVSIAMTGAVLGRVVGSVISVSSLWKGAKR